MKGRGRRNSKNKVMAIQKDDLLHHEPEKGDFEFCL